jgi:hypothetical protein
MPGELNRRRQDVLGAAATTIAAAQFGAIGSAAAQSIEANAPAAPAIEPETSPSFGPLKQIDAGVLNVGYAEADPATTCRRKRRGPSPRRSSMPPRAER